METSFTTVSELTNINFLLATLSNIIMVFYLYFKFELNENKPLPNLMRYGLQLGNAITNGAAKRLFKANGGAKQWQWFLYNVLSQIIVITACFRKVSRDVTVTSTIQRGDHSNISTTHYNLASDIHDDTLSLRMIACVFLNSLSISDTKLFNELAAKKKADKKKQKKLLAELNSISQQPKNKHNKRENVIFF